MATVTRRSSVAEHLASAVEARLRCLKSENAEWAERHTATIRSIEANLLPRGSGIDNGTTVDLDKSTGDKLVLSTAFHHMNEGGMYDGWTDHTVTVRASLVYGLDIRISGRDRNDIKAYLGDVFADALGQVVTATGDGAGQVTWTPGGRQ